MRSHVDTCPPRPSTCLSHQPRHLLSFSVAECASHAKAFNKHGTGKRKSCAGMGIIAQVGGGVSGWKEGQRVTAAPWTYAEQLMLHVSANAQADLLPHAFMLMQASIQNDATQLLSKASEGRD